MKTLLWFSLALFACGCHQEPSAPSVIQGSNTEKRVEVSTPGTNVTTVIHEPSAPGSITVKNAPAAPAPANVNVHVDTKMPATSTSPATSPGGTTGGSVTGTTGSTDLSLTPAPETPAADAGGDSLTVSENGQQRTLQTTATDTVSVPGNDNDVTLSSTVNRIEVTGNNNRINAQGVTTVSFSGSGNRVTFTGPKPAIEGVQADNVAESR